MTVQVVVVISSQIRGQACECFTDPQQALGQLHRLSFSNDRRDLNLGAFGKLRIWREDDNPVLNFSSEAHA